MNALQWSVGDKGHNSHSDVLVVQSLLKSKGFSLGLIDGVCGPQTVMAISKFQGTFLSHSDGLVEPGGKTWQQLSSASGSVALALQQWAGDSAQWSQSKKIDSMNPLLKPKVRAVLGELANLGFKPNIFYGWRSVAVQMKLYEAGNSKVKFSFHNAQKTHGMPNSYAADIVDQRYGWNSQAQSSGFWRALGEEAKKQGLYWGGDWSSFRDWAHVQLVSNSDLARVKIESGL